MLYLLLALGAPENRLRGIFPDPWNLMRIIPTEERGMNIFLNGRSYITDSKNLLNLITEKGLNPSSVIVEYNSRILKKEFWTDQNIYENDKIEILNIVGGG